MREVLVVLPLNEKQKVHLESVSSQLKFIYVERTKVTPEMVESANIIIGNIKPKLLSHGKRLELMQLDSAGVEHVTSLNILSPNVVLANGTGAYGEAIAEHMLAGLMTIQKKNHLYLRNMVTADWKNEGYAGSISGSKTLVLGFGDIGSHFAMKMNALGSQVIGVRKHKTPCPNYLVSLHQMEELDKLLPQVDIVACSLPGTSETKHLLNREKLAMMKKGAILVNVGRGSLIPTEDLMWALETGQLGGAAVDVTEVEPLPKDSKLWTAPNLLITPHISGLYHEPHILEKIVEIARENIVAFLAGDQLQTQVDIEAGYRKFQD
jgi:phosphoglycerate dehydrogenase-like enzyme